MNIQTKVGDEGVPQRTLDRAEAKLRKLERFVPRAGDEELQALMDFTRESGSASSDRMWKASALITQAGSQWYAAETAATAEVAIDAALKELKTELRRTKAKQETLLRKGGAFLKRLSRGFR